jgi:hypothetical protein
MRFLTNVFGIAPHPTDPHAERRGCWRDAENPLDNQGVRGSATPFERQMEITLSPHHSAGRAAISSRSFR